MQIVEKWMAVSLLCVLTTLACAHSAEKDTTYWHRQGNSLFNLSQAAYSNWAAGGDNAIAFDVSFNYAAEYKRAKHLWQNRLELAYGMNFTRSSGSQKTNDKIYLSSNYGYEIGHNWYLSASVTFNTQFANGYDYKTDSKVFLSQFMAPGYLSTGVGFTWTPRKWFTATLSPSSWRGTFVCNTLLSEQGAFGVEKGHRLFNEFGANFKFEFNCALLANMNLYSRIDLYSNYLRKPQNVDVRWDIQLTAKINKWFATTLSVNMIYDDDVKVATKNGRGSRLQIKEVLGIGLQASF